MRGKLVKYWLPVFVWMALIFSASTDLLSTQNTSRFLGPLLRRLVPGITDEAVRVVQFSIRKTCHALEYAVLALLLWRARREPVANDPRPWSAADARWAVLVSALYATTDEVHQALVPSRQGSVADVLLDTGGATLGILCLWHLGRRRNEW